MSENGRSDLISDFAWAYVVLGVSGVSGFGPFNQGIARLIPLWLRSHAHYKKVPRALVETLWGSLILLRRGKVQ